MALMSSSPKALMVRFNLPASSRPASRVPHDQARLSSLSGLGSILFGQNTMWSFVSSCKQMSVDLFFTTPSRQYACKKHSTIWFTHVPKKHLKSRPPISVRFPPVSVLFPPISVRAILEDFGLFAPNLLESHNFDWLGLCMEWHTQPKL